MKKSYTRRTIQIFWEHMRRHPGVLFVMVATTFIGAITLNIIPPLFYKQIVDIISTGDRTSLDVSAHLSKLLLYLVSSFSVAYVMWTIETFCDNYFNMRVTADLANTTFAYVQKHSYSFFTKGFVGSIVRKMNRFTAAYGRIHGRIFWTLLPTVIEVVLVFVVLGTRSLLLSLVVIGWVVVYLTAMYFFGLYKMKFERVAASADSDVAARVADTITNNINIKLFASYDREKKEFDRLNEQQFHLQLRASKVDAVIERAQALLMVCVEMLMIFVAIKLWREGTLSVGDFALIQSYLGTLFYRLWDVGRVVRDVYTQLADAQEMTEILETPHGIQDVSGAQELVVTHGAVEYRHVRFSYAAREVTHDFNLAIAPGEKVGLVGPSGAGKSTLVALLFRFYDVAAGEIIIDGQNISQVTQDSLRRQISLVPQDPILFHRSLLENIRYGKPDATNEEVMHAARLAHCDEFIDRLPEKYETFVGERGVRLSGGERQRVAIARAILKNAPILVLDEATSSLDSASEAAIQDALAVLMQGKTVIVIAHRLSTIMKMDRIVVVDGGKVVESGNHAALLNNDQGLYKQLWNLQAGGFISE